MARLIKIANSNDWHGKIKLGPYRQRRARFCRDRSMSSEWFAMLQSAVERHAAGEPLRPEHAEKLPRRLLESFGLVSVTAERRSGTFLDNVNDYIAELRDAGRAAKYVANTQRTLRAAGVAGRWRRLADVNRETFLRWRTTRKEAGASMRTIKNDATVVSAFCGWAVQAERMRANPLAKLPRIEDSAGRRRDRRALTDDEILRLLAVAGPRALCYRMALGTGLRHGELAQLQWRDVRLDEPRPTLELRPEATKNRKGGSLPLTADLARRLRDVRPVACQPTCRVFPPIPAFDTIEADLKRAGIETHETGEDGKPILRVGFHSLRATFVTHLQRAGLPPRVVMELARHRDYRLTATTYTDIRLFDLAGAVAMLPDFKSPNSSQSTARRRTGTDDAPIRSDQILDQIARISSQNGASACTHGDGGNIEFSKQKTAISAEMPSNVGMPKGSFESYSGRSRGPLEREGRIPLTATPQGGRAAWSR